MLEYEWGNPSTVMFTGNEEAAAPSAASVAASAQESDQVHRQMFDHYGLLPDHLISQAQHETTPAIPADFSLHHQFSPQQTPPHQHQHQQQQHIHTSLFDPRAFPGASAYPAQQPPPSMLSLDPLPGTVNAGHGLLIVPKSEDVGRPVDFINSRIGLNLNLGGRTYFSSEDDFVSRFYRRPRPAEPGLATSSNSPRCQAEGCNADLSHAKHYHRRHKVCEFHSKAATVIAAGLTQRFCQQCSRFHLLSEFDNGKRSCRKRLADHNRRRRKTQQPIQEIQKSEVENNARNSPLDNVARSPQDSRAQSVTVAVSPPDYFRQRPYQSASSSTSSSLFFSSG